MSDGSELVQELLEENWDFIGRKLEVFLLV
jgi:hypothetical protein